LTNSSPETLIRIVNEVPWVRECQGSRLLPVSVIYAIIYNLIALTNLL
jgi:hypothetical protein